MIGYLGLERYLVKQKKQAVQRRLQPLKKASNTNLSEKWWIANTRRPGCQMSASACMNIFCAFCITFHNCSQKAQNGFTWCSNMPEENGILFFMLAQNSNHLLHKRFFTSSTKGCLLQLNSGHPHRRLMGLTATGPHHTVRSMCFWTVTQRL